jgi:hypothetical protein
MAGFAQVALELRRRTLGATVIGSLRRVRELLLCYRKCGGCVVPCGLIGTARFRTRTEHVVMANGGYGMLIAPCLDD